MRDPRRRRGLCLSSLLFIPYLKFPLTIRIHHTAPRAMKHGPCITYHWSQEQPILKYRIYSNKHRGAYLIFRATSAALIRGRRLFKNCTRQIYFFYIFIQRYTFYLLIFLWTDTKLIVNLEFREKLTRWKKPPEFHDNESEMISGESELLCRYGTI